VIPSDEVGSTDHVKTVITDCPHRSWVSQSSDIIIIGMSKPSNISQQIATSVRSQ